MNDLGFKNHNEESQYDIKDDFKTHDLWLGKNYLKKTAMVFVMI